MNQKKNDQTLAYNIKLQDCIHVGQFSSSYQVRGQQKNDNQMKMKVIKIVDLRGSTQTNIRQSGKRNGDLSNNAKKFIKLFMGDISTYIRKKQGYMKVSDIPKSKYQKVQMKEQKDVYYIIRPFCQDHSLKYCLRNKTQKLKYSLYEKYMKEMFSLLVSFGGVKNHLMTTSNIFLNDFGDMEINSTSFEGVRFICGEDIVSQNEFIELYPYLDSQIFQRNPYQRLNWKSKIRSLTVNMLKIILKEQINLLNIEEDIKGNLINPAQKQIKILISEIKYRFQKFLSQTRIKNEIQKAQQYSRIKLFQLFKRVLIEEDNNVNYDQILLNILPWGDEKSNISANVFGSFSSLHDDVWDSQTDKQYFEERKLKSKYFYLPTKFNVEYKHLLKKKAWYEYFGKQEYCFNDNISRFVIQLLLNLQNNAIRDEVSTNDLQSQRNPIGDKKKKNKQINALTFNLLVNHIKKCNFYEYAKQKNGKKIVFSALSPNFYFCSNI